MGFITGNYISEEMSIYIGHYTTYNELKEIAIVNGLSPELARALCKRDKKITENNKTMLFKIIKRAMDNRKNIIPIINKGHKEALKTTKVSF